MIGNKVVGVDGSRAISVEEVEYIPGVCLVFESMHKTRGERSVLMDIGRRRR